MIKNGKKRFAAYMCLIFFFLCTLPAVCFGAVSSTADGGSLNISGNPMYFPAGTTVESLRAELSAQGKNVVLVVLKPDGSKRISGPIENGDRVEETDDTGLVISCVTAVLQDGSAVSSGLSSSGTSSNASSVQPGAVPSFIQDGKYSVFTGSVTVSDLRDQLEGAESLQVASASGSLRKSGKICTGDRIRILNNSGSDICETTAVVLGDLTRSGKITAHGRDLLYGYLTGKNALPEDLRAAADLNQDGNVDTADLLAMKKSLADSP